MKVLMIPFWQRTIVASVVALLSVTSAGSAQLIATAFVPDRVVSVKSIRSPHSAPTAQKHALTGLASFYRLRGKTSSGERFDANGLTAAHPSLPFNTRVRVTCVNTGKSVVVRINDRGPFK